MLSWLATWATAAVFWSAAVLCGLRARLVEHDRWAWRWIAVACGCWAAANTYYALVIAPRPAPMPSPIDIGYVSFPIALFAGLVAAARARLQRIPLDLWLDAAVAALGTAAIATAMVFRFVSVDVHNLPAVITTLVYPIEDVLLLSVLAGGGSLLGWRMGREWLFVACAIASIAVADLLVFTGVLGGGGVDGAWTNFGWTSGIALLAFGAWQRLPADPVFADAGSRPAVNLLLPTVFASICVLVLTVAGSLHLALAASGLAAAGLVLSVVRLHRSFHEVSALAGSRELALTDDLTGLPNRRRLLEDLDAAFRDGEPRVLAMFDLDGFKAYNDAYGHPEGDRLLQRLALQLGSAAGRDAVAYRLGGDEFCVLGRSGRLRNEAALDSVAAALTESGPDWEVCASFGTVLLPTEAETAAVALQLVDRRMYAQKERRPAAARQQARNVLLTALVEQQPALHDHAHDVTRLVRSLARTLGMSNDEADDVVRAAELHDVGKLAIPREILDKPAPLDEREWQVMRRHTVIGERMLRAAPALRSIAELVRSSHERWDGGGYPDRLAGDEIPLGARIVAVCDAFDAIVTDRVYRRGRTPQAAVSELRRCAGTQFDPVVVESFVTLVEEELSSASVAA